MALASACREVREARSDLKERAILERCRTNVTLLPQCSPRALSALARRRWSRLAAAAPPRTAGCRSQPRRSGSRPRRASECDTSCIARLARQRRAALAFAAERRAPSAAAGPPRSMRPSRRRPHRPPRRPAAFSHSSRRTRLLTCTMNSDFGRAARRLARHVAERCAAALRQQHRTRRRPRRRCAGTRRGCADPCTPSSASSKERLLQRRPPQLRVPSRTRARAAWSRPPRPDGGRRASSGRAARGRRSRPDARRARELEQRRSSACRADSVCTSSRRTRSRVVP